MRSRNQCTGFTASSLKSNDSQVSLSRIVGESSESNWVNDCFDKQADRSDSTVIDENFKTIFDTSNCLIANSHHVGEIQFTLLQSQVQTNIAALTDDCRARSFWFTTMLIGPQGDAV